LPARPGPKLGEGAARVCAVRHGSRRYAALPCREALSKFHPLAKRESVTSLKLAVPVPDVDLDPMSFNSGPAQRAPVIRLSLGAAPAVALLAAGGILMVALGNNGARTGSG